ncbi:hypothetical protein ACHAXN_008761 [Cyclotella atomus]
MTKRRKKEPSSQPDLDKFDDRTSPSAAADTSDIIEDGMKSNSGMSRAAKKRAKKRAKVGFQAGDVDQNDTTFTEAKKFTLPLDDSDNENELEREKIATKVEKKSKKKRKEAEPAAIGEEDVDADDLPDEAVNEMEPELEELLSTLTPMQILLLDEANGDEKPRAESDGVEANDLQDVNPLHIIGDVTTQHRAKVLLASIISPSAVASTEFYEAHWGKKPLIAAFDESFEEKDESTLQRYQQHVTRLDGFLNRTIIDEMIRKNKLRYGCDLNVTRYTDSMGNGLRHRITLDPPPKKIKKKNAEDDLEYIVANPKDVWSNVDTSHCTVRLLRPHEHNENIHAMLSLLESEFGCMVGSNAYLTPLNSQGFAPHYDDVDVFILQLEGFKRWRVYVPFNKAETLPRASSRDYTEKEVEEMGEEEVDMVLGPGDVMYLPRGWIHQAETVARPSHMPKVPGVKDDHSLHLTVSAMQNWSWADFLELLIPEALEGAVASDKSTSLREGLPVNFLSYMGTMHSLEEEDELPEGLKQVMEAQKASGNGGGDENESDDDNQVSDENALADMLARQQVRALQRAFKEEAKKKIMRVCKQAMSMLDDACDQIGVRFLSDRLPPALLKPEVALTKESHSTSLHHDATKKIWPNTLCRLVRPNIARLVIEESKAVIYHCLDNSLVFHETPLSPMEFEVDDAPALEQLLTTVEPHWIMVKDLIHGDVEDKMEIAQALYDEGLLATMLMENPDRSVQTG